MFIGPQLITNGLVFALDAANNKSYPGSGTTWNDLVGSNNGTLQNSPTFNTEKGGVIDLDGNNDRIEVSDPGYPSTKTDPFTLDVIFKVPTGATWYNQGSGTAIIGRGAYHGSLGILRASTDNRVTFFVRISDLPDGDPSSYIFDDAVVSDLARDVYHRITGTWDGDDTAKIYHNGELIGQETKANTGVFDSGDYKIGGDIAFGGSDGGYGEMSIAYSALYNRALSDSEISHNYNALKSRFI